MSGEFLSIKQLAERWRMHRRGLLRMRADGTGPAYVRIGGHFLYSIESVEAYETSKTYTHRDAERAA